MGADTVSESKQKSIKSRMLNGDIHLVMRSTLFKDNPYALDMDFKSLTDNLDIPQLIFISSQLTDITDDDALYRFLLTWEVSKMHEVVSKRESCARSKQLNIIIGMACQSYSNSKIKGSAIDYITNNEQDIFQVPKPDASLKSLPDADLNSRLDAEFAYASLDFITECEAGIKDDGFFKYLCQNFPYFIVYRFHKLGYVFEKYPDLFSVLFRSFHIDLEKSSGMAVLDILKKEYTKKNTRYKNLIKTYDRDIYQKAEPFGEALSEENVLQIEPVIMSVNSFLNTVKSPKANDFSKYVNNVKELKRKISSESVKDVQGIFPGLGEAWKNSEYTTLRSLTHMDSNASYLSIEPDSYKGIDLEHCFTGILKGDFPYNPKFPDKSYQHYLQCMEDYHSAHFLKILKDHSSLDKFSGLLRRAVQYVSANMSQHKCLVPSVSEKMPLPNDGLAEDTELLLSMLNSVAKNIEAPGRELEIFCYSTSMFLCSLTEKFLRLFYFYLVKERHVPSKRYVPSDITLGRLLNTANEDMADVFKRAHILHLACFLIGMPGIKLGSSYRNSLAHWASRMTPCEMTPNLVSSLLWLFTDVLNSVYIYFDTLPDGTSREEQRKYQDYRSRAARSWAASMND